MGFGFGFVDRIGAGQRNGHAALAADVGFAEEANRGVGLGEGFVDVSESDFRRFAFHKHGAGGRGTELADIGDWKPEDGADMQRTLREVLRNEGDESRVMRSGGDLAEDDIVSFDEELDAKEATPTEGLGDGTGDVLGGFDGFERHGMRLPGLAVVSLDLSVTDGRTEGRAA